MQPFRDNLLAESAIVLAGGAEAELAEALAALDARVESLPAEADAEAWATEHSPLHAIVCDTRAGFAADGLDAALEATWAAVRAVAVGALIPGEQGGKVILIGPTPDAGEHAEAARAGLENLARTLSVEWARHKITVTAVAPGSETSGEQVAALVCFLVSRGGDYFSGCRFELGLIRSS